MIRRLLRRLIRNPLTVLGSQDAYAQWAANYPPNAHNLFMQTEEQAVEDLLPDLNGKTVLDLGCGTGRWGQIAHDRGAKLVLGFDHSDAMLSRGVLSEVSQAELDALPLPAEVVDVVVSGLAIGHINRKRLDSTFREIARVLKPNGEALVSDFHPFQAWQGAQRTFKAESGEVFAVEHYPHRYADYHDAATAAGLQIVGVREPALIDTPPESPPVVLVFRLQKSQMTAITRQN